MFLPRTLGRLLLLWLLAAGLVSRAEGIYPQLSNAAFDSLRSRLRTSRPDTNRVRLLVRLAQGYLTRSDESSADLDPARPYCQQAAALSEQLHFPTGRISSLYLLGQLHALTEEDTLGPDYFRRGLALSQRLGNRRLEAFGWYWLSQIYSAAAPGLLARLACLQRSKALFQQLHDQANEAYLLKCIADEHLRQGHSAQAIRELLVVEALYRAAGHRKLFYTYDLLQASYRQLGDYKEALRYSLAALDNARAVQDSTLSGALYARLAMLYREQKQYPAALGYYHKALVKMQQTGDSINAVSMAGIIVRIMVQQHRTPEALAFFTRATKAYSTKQPHIAERIADYMVELHVALGHYAQAEPYAGQLVAFLHSGQADDGEARAVRLTLSKFYLRTGRYNEARHYLQQSMTLTRHSATPLDLAGLHLLLFKADSAQGRFPAAIVHYQQYKQLTDSVLNEKKNQQLATLQMQYDTRKKEQNIALLTRQTQAQQPAIGSAAAGNQPQKRVVGTAGG